VSGVVGVELGVLCRLPPLSELVFQLVVVGICSKLSWRLRWGRFAAVGTMVGAVRCVVPPVLVVVVVSLGLWEFLLAFVVVVLFAEMLCGRRVRRFVLVLEW
jgi:hypothetical protein